MSDELKEALDDIIRMIEHNERILYRLLLLKAGWTPKEIAILSGKSLDEIMEYVKNVDDTLESDL